MSKSRPRLAMRLRWTRSGVTVSTTRGSGPCMVLLVLAFTLATMGATAAPAPFALLHSLYNPSTNVQAGTQQGWSVAIDGDLVVVGAPADNLNAQDAGLVKVFDALSGALLHTLTNPSPALSDEFGWSVAISGTRVVVGAPFDDAGGVDSGRAYVYDLAGAAPAAPVAVLNNPTPSPGDMFGYSVALSGTRAVVGAHQDDLSATDSGAAYVFELASATPAVPLMTLTNPTPAMNDLFGWSVAVLGPRVLVGAHRDDAGRTDAGAAYVYDLGAAVPQVPVLTLTNPVPTNGISFGFSVAISGRHAVIATPLNDHIRADDGGVYIYDLLGAAPAVPKVTLTNPNWNGSDSFGRFVAISGTRVVVGAPNDSLLGNRAGLAYVYDLSSATPNQPMIRLSKPSPSASDFFGTSLAISGTRIAAGTPGDDLAGSDSGCTYVFELGSSTPTLPMSALTSLSPEADRFGWSVAFSGTRVVVGAPWDDSGLYDGGKAFVYDLGSATPSVPALTLVNPLPTGQENFGWSVAISSNWVVVGVFSDNTTPGNSGIAYVYDLASATPALPVLTLTNPSPAPSAAFGFSAAASDRYVVVGAAQDSTGAFFAGKVYVYDFSFVLSARPTFVITNPAPAEADFFGNAVAISGPWLVIAAYQDDIGTNDAGSVYVYNLAGATPRTPVLKLTNPTPFVSDNFGEAIAISGTRVVVGASSDNTGPIDNTGIAYVFDLDSPKPADPVLTLHNPRATEVDAFGGSVGISGSLVVVGAFGEDVGATNAGVAYVYDLDSATPGEPVDMLVNPERTADGHLGFAVAIDGNTIVAGGPQFDTKPPFRGTMYVFGPRPALKIVPAAPGIATLSWSPPTSSGFVLQHADQLAPTNWVNSTSGATNPVTIPTTSVSRFYRLFQP